MSIIEVGSGSQRAQVSALNVSSQPLAYPANVTAGDLLVCLGRCWHSTTPHTSISVTDTRGTTYSVFFVDEAGSNDSQFIAYGIAPSSGANTVTVTPNSLAETISLAIDEFSGVDTTTPLSVGGSTSTGASTTASDSLTTLTAGELVVGVMGHTGGAPTITPSNTQIGEQEDNNTQEAFAAAFRIAGATGSYSISWTIGSSVTWTATTLSFKETAGTPAPPAEYKRFQNVGGASGGLTFRGFISLLNTFGQYKRFDGSGSSVVVRAELFAVSGIQVGNGFVNQRERVFKNVGVLKSTSVNSGSVVKFSQLAQSVKLFASNTNNQAPLKSLASGSRFSSVATLSRARAVSQVSFSKTGAGQATTEINVVTQSSVLKQMTAAISQSVYPMVAAFGSKFGQTVVSSAAQRFLLRNSAVTVKLVPSATLTQNTLKNVILTLKQAIFGVGVRVAPRSADSMVKSGVAGTANRVKTRTQPASVKFALSAIQARVNARVSDTVVKGGLGSALTLIKPDVDATGSKFAIVVVSSVAQALKLRGAITSGKVGAGLVVEQLLITALQQSHKEALSGLLQNIGLFTFIDATSLSSAVVVDPCSGTYNYLDIANRLENEYPVFTLCGGEDRFAFEESVALNELKKRGLI